jgi:hypothetical protein
MQHVSGSPGEVGTLASMVLVPLLAVALFNAQAERLGDPRLARLGFIFALKVLAGTAALFYGWVPELATTATNNISLAYDPQRYYVQAQMLVDAGFDRSALPLLNYTGVLFYFGAGFQALGHNPVVPLLMNSLTTLAAMVLLVRLAYAARSVPRQSDWTIGLVMLVPEVIWYDAISSRETLTMALVVIPISVLGLRLLGQGVSSATMVGAGLALGLLAVVRTPVMLPLGAVLLLMAMFVRPNAARSTKTRFGRSILVGLIVAGSVLAAPLASRAVGSYSADYASSTARVLGGTTQGYAFSETSLAVRLAPDNPLEFVLFTPPRVGLYLLSPFPNVSVTPGGLSRGAWSDWQNLSALASTVLYVALLPRMLVGARRARGSPAGRVLLIPAFVLMVSVAMNNIIVVERYRLMAVPFLLGVAWLGRRDHVFRKAKRSRASGWWRVVERSAF